jgi:hypothetical protein
MIKVLETAHKQKKIVATFGFVWVIATSFSDSTGSGHRQGCIWLDYEILWYCPETFAVRPETFNK